MSKKYKPIEELTICDNFMFVKVFGDEAREEGRIEGADSTNSCSFVGMNFLN